MHAIFLRNLSPQCFPQRNKARIYSFTPTTKSRRPRSAAFMQSSERMESSLARIASLICSQRTDLIYNCSILNFICCSAASDRVRNSSGKWTIHCWDRKIPQLFWLRAKQPTWGDWFQSILAPSSMIIGLPHPLLSISSGNMTFHMSELWHGEINEKKGGGGFESFWVFSSLFSNSSWNTMSAWQY